MKNVLIAAALVMFAATATAGDLAVSKSALTSMGLASMNTMSDSEGLTVRGKGTSASVWGGSHTKWVVAVPNSSPVTVGEAENHYEAGASWLGKDSAAHGNSLSFSGQVQAAFAADPTGFALQVQVVGAVAGGSASAFAH